MSILSRIKARSALKKPEKPSTIPVHENLPKRLRLTAESLEQVYGQKDFIERIKTAKMLAQDAMDQWS
jgi:hypothetical protein